MKTVTLPENLVNSVVNYLATQPYQEVYVFISEMGKAIEAAKQQVVISKEPDLLVKAE